MNANGSWKRFGTLLMLCVMVLVSALFCGCPRARDPQVYIKQLDSEKEDARKRAVDELIRLGEDAVPDLIAALGSSSPRQREGALAALAGAHSLRAWEAVAEMLRSPDSVISVRIAAIQAMGKLAELRKRAAVELLEQALRQEEALACIKAAAESLRDLHYLDATNALLRALQEDQGAAAVFAAHALYSSDRLPEAAELLTESLFSSDLRAQSAASMCVNELADQFIDELLKAEAARPDPQPVRQALAEIRNKLLEELKGNLMPERVREIMRAFGKIADAPSADELMKVVTGEEKSLSSRAEAALALGAAALSDRSPNALDDRIISFLTENHRNEKLDMKVRIACAISLCKLQRLEGVQYLLAQLSEGKEADAELRIAAQEALSASGSFVVPHLMQKLDDPNVGATMYWAAAKTLGELRVEQSVPRLNDLLTHPGPPIVRPVETEEEEGAEPKPVEDFRYPPYVRWAAAIALGQIGGQDALGGLKKALGKEANPTVIFYIERAMKNLAAEKE